MSNLISLVAEISCETPLLPQNSEAEKPIAFAPMEHNGVADNDLRTAARRCSAAAEEMRALIFEIEGYARYGYRRAEEAAKAMADTRKNVVSFDALAATAVDNDAKLQSYLDEARLCVKRSAKFATLGVAVVKDTGGLAEQAAVAAHGLGHLLSCCTATDQFAVVAHTLEDRTLKAQPDLIIVGGSAFPDRS
jgi:methyl-accepting chemotaxis protein